MCVCMGHVMADGRGTAISTGGVTVSEVIVCVWLRVAGDDVGQACVVGLSVSQHLAYTVGLVVCKRRCLIPSTRHTQRSRGDAGLADCLSRVVVGTPMCCDPSAESI